MEYRLDKYRIIETENSMLWWEAHFPMAMQRRGKCFILGDILIIGRTMNEENGYLILEFNEQLEKLPVWDKTSFYCYSSNLLDIATSENLSEDFLQRKMFLSEINKEGQKSIIGLKTGKFRLGQYQIIVTDDEVEWQAHEGINEVFGGQCIIESDVLFIGTRKYDRVQQNKEIFTVELNRLPQWDNTFAWCKYMVLQACQPQQQTNGFRTASRHEDSPPQADRISSGKGFKMKSPLTPLFQSGASSGIAAEKAGDERNKDKSNSSFFKQPSVSSQNRYTGTVKRLLRSGLIWLKAFWLRIQPGNFRLKHLLPLVVAGLLLGLVMLLNSAEKKLHRSHFAKDHHHKYDDKD